MTVRIQNPDATVTVQELYDIVGELRLELDEIISPVALVDDGWRRVTYIAFAETIAASTAANDRALHSPSPDFSFQLLYLQLTGTGNLAGTVSIKLDPQAVIPGTDIGYADIVLDGVADPEQHRSLANLGTHQPTAPPNMNWDVRHPTTGVGETLIISAILAQVPRGMRFGT